MKMRIVDNAIDSLKMSLEFFDSYLKTGKYQTRYLKLTITFLHNALELLIKSILISENELLIYPDVRDKKILEALRIKRDNDSLDLDEILIKNENVKTISYSDLVNVYNEMFGCSKKTEIVLNRLGQYRNSITHFGIDENENLDILFNTIYESFDIILYVLYPQLLEIDEYFSYNDVIDILEDWTECGRDIQRELCVKSSHRKIHTFTSIFKDVLLSDIFKNFLSEKNIQMITHKLNFDSDDFWIEFEQNDNYMFGLLSCYSAFHNITVFQEDNGIVYFIVEHEKGNIYVYNSTEIYDWEPEKFKRWEDDIKVNTCKVKKLNEKNLAGLLRELVLINLSMSNQ